jgi:hypothetical protein
MKINAVYFEDFVSVVKFCFFYLNMCPCCCFENGLINIIFKEIESYVLKTNCVVGGTGPVEGDKGSLGPSEVITREYRQMTRKTRQTLPSSMPNKVCLVGFLLRFTLQLFYL